MAVRVAGCIAIAVMSATLGACGSSSSSPHKNKAPSGTAATEAQIKHNWLEFFSPSTPAATTISLLQNGKRFAAAINAQAKSPFAKESSASVSAVKLTSPTTAKVTYTLKIAGQAVPGLENATGLAVKSGSTWQVADATFCQLLKLQGPAPAACPKG